MKWSLSLTLLRAKLLRFLLHLKITLNIRCDDLSAKGLTFWSCWIAVGFSMFEKKIFRISVFLASCVKLWSPTSTVFSEDFVLSENKVFQYCLLSSKSLSSKYLLTNLIYKKMLNVDYQFLQNYTYKIAQLLSWDNPYDLCKKTNKDKKVNHPFW